MLPSPSYCRREAFDLFVEALAELESSAGLLVAALAIAMNEQPDVDVEATDAQLSQWAQAVRKRVISDSPTALLAHAHALLFDELGFSGSAHVFDEPRSSYLPDVLRRRTGLPIAICLVYKLVLERVGLTVTGINAPGHFIAAVDDGRGQLLIDPFAGGRLVSRDDAIARARGMTRSPRPADDMLLRPASHREWLRRMLRNLHALFSQRGDRAQLGAMLELSHTLD